MGQATLVLLTCVSVAVGISSLRAEDPDPYTHTLYSDRLNGVHSDLKAEISPVTVGPVTVRLTTPSHNLEVLEHELRLGPVDKRVDAATLRARYQGEAQVVAELELAGMTSEIDDHIVLPLQETEITGLVEIARDGDGYRVTTIETPSHVEIQVESDLAARLEILCRGFAVMTMGNVDCEALDQALSVVKIPLPEPGQEYFISSADLTEEERRQIEAYLRQR